MREAIIPPGKERSYDEFHFSPAMRVGSFLHVSGHIGRGPDGQISDDPETQFRHAFASVSATLAHAGASWADVIEMTSYHVGLREHLPRILAVHDEFVSEPYPACTAVGVTELAEAEAIIEIAVVAHIG